MIAREIQLSKLLDQELSGDTKRINDFFIELFEGLEKEKIDENIIYFKYINGKRKNYMREDFKKSTIYLSHKHIWSFFESELNYKYGEIKELTYSMLELHMNRKVFKTELSNID